MHTHLPLQKPQKEEGQSQLHELCHMPAKQNKGSTDSMFNNNLHPLNVTVIKHCGIPQNNERAHKYQSQYYVFKVVHSTCQTNTIHTNDVTFPVLKE